MLLEAGRAQKQTNVPTLTSQSTLQVRLPWAKQQRSGQTGSPSGRVCWLLASSTPVAAQQGRHGQISAPAALASCSTKSPSAGSKRGQKHVCSQRSPPARGAGSGSAAQRGTVAPSRSLHSGTFPATAQPRRAAPAACSPLPSWGTGPATSSCSVLRSGLSRGATSHLRVSRPCRNAAFRGREDPHASGRISGHACYCRQSQRLC